LKLESQKVWLFVDDEVAMQKVKQTLRGEESIRDNDREDGEEANGALPVA
jgi:hypothetical protein